MKKWFKTLVLMMKKLKIQLFLTYFLVFFLFFTAVFVLVSGSIRTVLIDQIGNNRVALLRQISERANMIKTSSITLSNLYSHEILNSSFLANDRNNQSQRQKTIDHLNAQKQIYDEVFDHIGLGFEVLFMGMDGQDYRSSGIGTDAETWIYQPWFRQLIAELRSSDDSSVQFTRTFSSLLEDKTVYRFAAGRILGVGKKKGLLLIVMNEQLLEDVYGLEKENGGDIYIYDQAGFIVSHSNKKMLGKQFIDVDYMKQTYGVDRSVLIKKQGQKYMLSTYLDEETGWTIVEESPEKNILGSLNRTLWMLGILLLLGLALALAVSIFVSWRISEPLIELSKAMDRFGEEDFKQPCIWNGTQEIEHLQKSFVHMGAEISKLMNIVMEREQQKRELEVNFLRAQIDPHFLYNTLFSVRCALEVGKNEKASQMLTAFISLLRSTLSKQESLITLSDEIETTRKYLVVQKLRYGEKINYELDMQKGTEFCLIPPLILQPVVENAIFHGIEAKNETGTIVIESAIVGDILTITITDDGAGMDSETLQRVRDSLEWPVDKEVRSIGLSNIHHRIRLDLYIVKSNSPFLETKFPIFGKGIPRFWKDYRLSACGAVWRMSACCIR